MAGGGMSEFGAMRDASGTRASVGMAALPDRAYLRVRGSDRATWLQGLIAGDLLTLSEGEGIEAAVMNIQGRLLSLLRVFSLPGELLIDLPLVTRARVLALLDQYLMMEDVEIESPDVSVLTVQGPEAASVVGAVVELPGTLAPWGATTAQHRSGAPLVLARVTHTGEDGYDLFVPIDAREAVESELLAQVAERGGARLEADALDGLRVEAGIPAWGAELSEAVGPLEARLDRAISRTKGCYVGQEIIARIDARGQVNNGLAGLDLDATVLPSAGSDLPLHVPGSARPVGRITSLCRSPSLGRPIALGYLRREHATPGTEVVVGGEGGGAVARVAALPFVPWRFPLPIYGEGGA